MTRILHILTRPDDALARNIVEFQRELPENEVMETDLTRGEVDYQKLLEDIFDADSIQVW